jgi:hypothetical protein
MIPHEFRPGPPPVPLCAYYASHDRVGLVACNRTEDDPIHHTPSRDGAEGVAASLERWWMRVAGDEVIRVVPKAVEYGSTDLRDIGRAMAEAAGREVGDEEAVELGIYFYIIGKIARWSDAVKGGGRRVSDDTLHDIGVYVRMAQRNREVGGWPTGPKAEAHNEDEEDPFA